MRAMRRFYQRQAGFADAPIVGDVLVANLGGPRPSRGGARSRRQRRHARSNIVERPAEIDRRRSTRQQGAMGALQRGVVGRVSQGERQPIGAGGADQRRAPYDHGLDRNNRRVEVADPARRETMRQQRLVDDLDRAAVAGRPKRPIGASVDFHGPRFAGLERTRYRSATHRPQKVSLDNIVKIHNRARTLGKLRRSRGRLGRT
jgi:hypothetical protein